MWILYVDGVTVLEVNILKLFIPCSVISYLVDDCQSMGRAKSVIANNLKVRSLEALIDGL